MKFPKVAAVALVTLLLPFAQAYAGGSGPIKVGFAIAKSGWLSNYDSAPFKAAVMKIEEINKAGGLLGRKIEYTAMDTKTDQARAATVGAQLVDSGVDMLVVSCDYDFGAPAALAAQRAGKISFSLCAADPKMGVQGVGPLAFTATSAAQSEGIAIAEYAQKKMHLKTAYVLEDTTIEYNKSACAGFRAAWTAGAGKNAILGNDTFKNDDPSIAAQITRLKALPKKPDAIFICSFTPGGASAVRQLRAAGIEQPILSDTAMSDNYWLNAVPGLKGFYVPALMSLYGDDPRPQMNAFLKKYKARYGALPVSSYSVLGYSLIEEWAYAVKKAKTTDSARGSRRHEHVQGPTFYRWTDDLHEPAPHPS